tara:strand:+ start:99 stop:728 length:630 start_codon:yes stop_codon:yes gene_type:complete
MCKKLQFPEGKIKKIIGQCITITGDDIDTDRIIPARFLKCVSFNNLGDQVFADDREELKGSHPFDQEQNKNASILIVNDNFGCGSSREHAPQALMRWGIRGIIGESFAEIFYGNCISLGIPCATSDKRTIQNIQKNILTRPERIWELKIKELSFHSKGFNYKIKIENGPLEMFQTGRWDGTSQLVAQTEKLNKKLKTLPYLNHFKDVKL